MRDYCFSGKKTIVSVMVFFFAVDFVREALSLVVPYMINVISVLSGFILLLLLKRLLIRRALRAFLFALIFFLVISLINGFVDGFVDGYTISYTLYKMFEMLVVMVVASSITRECLISFYDKFIAIFFIIHIPLFVYYLLAIWGFVGFFDRIIVFAPNRFGGLSGEPAQFGQMLFMVMIFLVSLRRMNGVKYFNIKIFSIFIIAIASFSNAFFIPLLVLIVCYNVYEDKKIVLMRRFFTYGFFLFLIAGSFFVNDRMDINLEQLWFIVLNAKRLGGITVEGVGSNSVTTRFYELVYSLTLIKEYVGCGLGSSFNYPFFSGIVGDERRVNFYGISQLGYELGLMPMFVFVFWMIRMVKNYRGDFFDKSVLTSVFVVMLLINGLAFKLYWFVLFSLLILNDVSDSDFKKLSHE